MASTRVDVDKIVREALSTISGKYPNDYKRLSATQTEEVSRSARQTVTKLLKGIQSKSIEGLTHIRMEEMKKNYTYEMTVKKVGQEEVVDIKGRGGEVRSTIDLSTKLGVVEATNTQIVSIIIEAVILMLQLIGIRIPDEESVIQRVSQTVIDSLADPVITEAAEAIVTAYSSNNFPSVATAVLKLVFTLLSHGDLWGIIRDLLAELSWYDWILTSVQIAAFLAALVVTDGLAVIAEMIVEVTNAAFFLAKLANMVLFRTKRQRFA